MRHEVLGLTLHPFDAAANKLALVGRVEVRDWIDVIECHQSGIISAVLLDDETLGIVWRASGSR